MVRQQTVDVAALAIFAIATVCYGQANYQEAFESSGTVAGGAHGPSGLISAGWQFRNQSDPEGSGDWNRSAWAYQGNWSLSVDVSVSFWDGNNAEASSWGILPAIPGQLAGDTLRLFAFSTQAPPLVPGGHLEIRYSPSGGTDTGGNPDDVGDFTQLLLDIPATNDTWTEHSVVVPGSGRLAFRYHVPPSGSQGGFWGFFEIDNLSIGAPAASLPIPGPGETVHWTTALSPIVIDEHVTIPAGGTLIIDPGVSVEVTNNAYLTFEGTAIADGVVGNPVVFSGTSRIRVPGTLDCQSSTVRCLMVPVDGGSLLFSNTTFESPGALTTVTEPTYIWGRPVLVSLDACQFDGAYLRVGNAAVRLVDTQFVNTYCEVGGGYLYVDNLTIDQSPYYGFGLIEFEQPVFLDNVTVTNATWSGLDLAGAHFLLGGGNVLSGNPYPVEIGGSSILPGSVLPAAGNLNNAILVDDASIGAGGRTYWADAGIPYDIPDAYTLGNLEMLPGVNVRIGPNVTVWGDPGFVDVRGTPDAPVVFEQLNAGQTWQGLQYFHRFENAVIDGGQIGARFHSSSTVGYIDNCVIQNCEFGTQNDVIVRKTRFINNQTASWGDNWTGALDGFAGPNSFEGNGVAVDSTGMLIDARSNWWNAPSGPTAPHNPGGTGEVILQPGVDIVPFLTAPPDFSNNPPRVKLNKNSFLLEPGSKVIVSWSSDDDAGVLAHRLDFDHPLNGWSTVVDLSGTQRAYEWTVPDIGFAVNNKAPVLRVTAIDAQGQEGWDEQAYLIPTGTVQGTLTVTTDLTGPFTAGDTIGELCWTAEGTNPLGYTTSAAIYFDGDGRAIGLGGVTSYLSCLALELEAPYISSDTVRVALRINESLNRAKYFFTDEFEIRPDSRIGDAPPTVQMTSPAAGQQYNGGETVPIAWTAADDEGLRSFTLQASYDAGRTWHVIAEDLPGTATSFAWQLPPSTGMPEVCVRVIASDVRFQTTSDGGDAVFAILAGSSRPSADFDFDGDVDTADFATFTQCFGGAFNPPAASCPAGANADLDTDGDVDLGDFAIFTQGFTGAR